MKLFSFQCALAVLGFGLAVGLSRAPAYLVADGAVREQSHAEGVEADGAEAAHAEADDGGEEVAAEEGAEVEAGTGEPKTEAEPSAPAAPAWLQQRFDMVHRRAVHHVGRSGGSPLPTQGPGGVFGLPRAPGFFEPRKISALLRKYHGTPTIGEIMHTPILMATLSHDDGAAPHIVTSHHAVQFFGRHPQACNVLREATPTSAAEDLQKLYAYEQNQHLATVMDIPDGALLLLRVPIAPQAIVDHPQIITLFHRIPSFTHSVLANASNLEKLIQSPSTLQSLKENPEDTIESITSMHAAMATLSEEEKTSIHALMDKIAKNAPPDALNQEMLGPAELRPILEMLASRNSDDPDDVLGLEPGTKLSASEVRSQVFPKMLKMLPKMLSELTNTEGVENMIGPILTHAKVMSEIMNKSDKGEITKEEAEQAIYNLKLPDFITEEFLERMGAGDSDDITDTVKNFQEYMEEHPNDGQAETEDKQGDKAEDKKEDKAEDKKEDITEDKKKDDKAATDIQERPEEEKSKSKKNKRVGRSKSKSKSEDENKEKKKVKGEPKDAEMDKEMNIKTEKSKKKPKSGSKAKSSSKSTARRSSSSVDGKSKSTSSGSATERLSKTKRATSQAGTKFASAKPKSKH
eukprot:GHVT01006168.1.p1 GENE.GHVT01006168.1~~GHVT01006168.1.p1  ORF type:complete len:633 (+),score=155.47 GHVT01006168.1:129-2027(+)